MVLGQVRQQLERGLHATHVLIRRERTHDGLRRVNLLALGFGQKQYVDAQFRRAIAHVVVEVAHG